MKPIVILLVSVLCIGAASASLAAEGFTSTLLMEAQTGQILELDNIDQQWPPASVVKLMLLLIYDEARLEGRFAPTDTVVATAAAQRQGGSQIYLAAGEKATYQKLIEAVAVGSANDAAVAIAIALHGTRAAAIAAMNAKAAELGMTNTNYVNVTGLPEEGDRPDDVTSARDLALLAREVVNNHPDVLKLTGLTWTRFRKGLVLGCTNTLMKEFEGMDGLKTGFHNRSGNNLVATAKRGDRRLIAVALGCATPRLRDDLITRMLEEGFSGWKSVEVLVRGQVVDHELPVDHSWWSKVPVEAGQPLSYLARPGDEKKISIILATSGDLVAPVSRGDLVGELQIVMDGRILSSAPAVAGRDVGRAWLKVPFKLPGAQRLAVDRAPGPGQ